MGNFALSTLASIFAIMNPIANVPIFLALTANQSQTEKRILARRSTLIAFFIVLFFAVFGQIILKILGITLNAFRIAGGILLFFIAFNLLQGKTSKVHDPNQDEHEESMVKEDLAIVPLATPILAGPGTITTVMVLSGGYSSIFTGTLIVILATLAVLVVTFFLFYHALWVQKHLPQTTINLITRMMGLLLTVIAVQMAATGLSGLFPILR
ncbi:MAG: MarC family protein [Peptococcaceae bacterium]|nr:MarC family protein [Peptococcaceae bacterium]